MDKKRWFDLIALAPAIPVALLFGGLGYLTVRLTSNKPAIYVQERQGKHGLSFRIYKLRTMESHTNENGLTISRVTKVGKFLRKTKIDELPQVLNVIRGDMHIVGPRPRVSNLIGHPHDGRFALEKLAADSIILSVKPGLTGEWQIQSARFPKDKIIPIDLKNKIEEKYVQDGVSLRRDFIICVKTVGIIVTGARDNSTIDKTQDRHPP